VERRRHCGGSGVIMWRLDTRELDDFCDDGVEHMEEEECPAMGAEIGNNRTVRNMATTANSFCEMQHRFSYVHVGEGEYGELALEMKEGNLLQYFLSSEMASLHQQRRRHGVCFKVSNALRHWVIVK
ncbi:hypothetical protein L195_g009506, partial [Trifolium pratense]